MGMFRFALFNLLSRKLRSALALLGLTVAIVGMVALFSVIEGLDELTSKTFSRIPGIVIVQAGAPLNLFSNLPADWVDEVAEIPGVAVAVPEVLQRVNVINGKMIVSPPRFLYGVDIPTHEALSYGVYRDEIVEGRFFGEEDRGTNHAVASRTVADEFGLQVGDTFQLNGYDVELVGIYETGSMLIDTAVLMEIERVRSMTRYDANSVSSIYVEAEPGEDEAVVERVKERFRGRELEAWKPSSLTGVPTSEKPLQELFSGIDRWLKGGTHGAAEPKPAPDAPQATKTSPPRERPEVAERWKVDETLPIDVRPAEEWGERVQSFTADLDFVMTILAGIGVVIAVLGIVNTMLMSVTERIIEIGILKANGWSRKNVLVLIACESGLLGFMGGCLGSVLGWAATLVINGYWPNRVQLYAGPGLLSFSVAFATVLGVAAGLYPAVWAMRLMPMDAIRRG